MTAGPFVRRTAALGLLVAAVLIAGSVCTAMGRAYVDGQRLITEKQAQLRGLRDLAAARGAFERLIPRKNAAASVLPAEADAGKALQDAVTRAAEAQQVIVDAVDALPAEPVTRPAMVHLRATQAGLYAFLRAVEDTTPYLLASRLEITPSRAADPEHGKPFVVAADIRLAVLTAPAVPTRRRAPSADPSLPGTTEP